MISKSKKKSSFLLIFSTISYLIFLGLIIHFSSSFLESSYSQAKYLAEKQLVKNKLITTMYSAARERTFILLSMVRYKDEFKLDDLNQELSYQAQIFLKARTKLLSMGIKNTQEKQLFSKLDIAAKNAHLIKQVADLFIGKQHAKAQFLLLHKVMPIQNITLANIANLIENYETAYNQHLANIEKTNKQINKKYKVFVLSIVAISLFIFIIFLYSFWKREARSFANHMVHKNAAREKLSFEESHDELTGLINFIEFQNRILEVLRRSENHEENAVLIINIGNIDQIKSTFGKQAKNALLCQIAKHIRKALRSSDLIARISEDNFAVILMACNLPQVKKISNNILNNVYENKFNWQDNSLTITASIGATQVVDFMNTSDLDSILSKAETACLCAISQGSNQYQVS